MLFFVGVVVVSAWCLIGFHSIGRVNCLVSNQPVQTLLQAHKVNINVLKGICEKVVGSTEIQQKQPYCNDVFYLRHCLSAELDGYDEATMKDRFQSTLKWRLSDQGQKICSAATSAIEQATSSVEGGKKTWNNDPVLANAPHSSLISRFITPTNALTTLSSTNDLVYCIRAGYIDDVELMSTVSIDQMVEFFLYAKEINAIVANMRSLQSNQLVCIVTCNDLSNVKLIGGSQDFRKALSKSSKLATDIYPSSYIGPTLLLNLPKLVSALVKLFTPLFPKAVTDRLKFEQGPLRDVDDLRKIASFQENTEYSKFVKQLDEILYS